MSAPKRICRRCTRDEQTVLTAALHTWRENSVHKQALRSGAPCGIDAAQLQEVLPFLELNFLGYNRNRDICSHLSQVLKLHSLGYRVVATGRSGSYGLILHVETAAGSKHIAKVSYIASKADAKFRNSVRMQTLFAGFSTPEVHVPEVEDAYVVHLPKHHATVGVLVMPFIAGDPLGKYVSDGAVDLHKRIECLQKASRFIKYINSKGYCHGDIHKNNWIVGSENDILYLIDFDSAERINPSSGCDDLEVLRWSLPPAFQRFV